MLQWGAERGRGDLGMHLGHAVVPINPLDGPCCFTLSPLQAGCLCFFLHINICSIVLPGNKSLKSFWLAK